MVKRWNLRWIVAVVAIVTAIGALGAYRWQRPLGVHVAQIEKDVPIQVFGLGTVEAQTLSKVGFETAGTLVELKVDQATPSKLALSSPDCKAGSRKRGLPRRALP